MKRDVGTWLKEHIDLALVLAAATEIPRWTVAFLAIHEPLWVGVPLGALLAWALKDGWNGYFRTKRLGILLLNLAALGTAIFVITPVLYVMTFVPVDQVDLTMVFGDAMVYRMAWAGLLALSTFLPLIQLSAVRAIGENSHAVAGVAQMEPNDRKTPSTPVFLPQGGKRDKPTAQGADTDDLTLEKMLEGVNLDGVPGMSKAAVWNAIYTETGSKGTADERTAAHFGVSKRTLQRERLEGDWR